MKKHLSSLFLRKTENWQFWVLFTIVIKGFFFCYILYHVKVHDFLGFISNLSPDSISYLEPIENFVTKGDYLPDHRMPGYGIIYLPLFILFKKSVALNILITLQFFTASISVYILALVSKYLFRSDRYFYTVFYMFLLSAYSNFYDHNVLTESFTCSFLIFATYFFLRAIFQKRNIFYLISGSFITGVIFLRPVFFPLLFLFLAVLFFTNLSKCKNSIFAIFLYLLPILIAESFWMSHNYIKHKRIQLLMNSFLFGKENENYYRPCLEFCQSWGGNYIWWRSGNPIRWFGVGVNETGDSLIHLIQKEKINIPNYIYTSKFNEDSLIRLRNLISDIKINGSFPWDNAREAEEKYVKNKFNQYRQSIQKEKPFIYYIKSKIIYCKYFFLTTIENNPFANSKNKLKIIIDQVNKTYYYLILISGIIGLVFLIKKLQKNKNISILVGIVLYTIIIHPLFLRIIENRYLRPAFPFLILASAYFIITIIDYLKRKSHFRITKLGA